VRGLTLRQPWAWAIFHAGKDVENRFWTPRQTNKPLLAKGGRLIIHAGLRPDPCYATAAYTIEQIAELEPGTVPPFSKMPKGMIVGCVTVVDFLRGSPSAWAQNGPKIWNWILANPVAVQPFPFSGARGLWDASALARHARGRELVAV
jgi:hypothetical protein